MTLYPCSHAVYSRGAWARHAMVRVQFFFFNKTFLVEAIAIIKARNVSRLTALRRKCDGDTLLNY